MGNAELRISDSARVARSYVLTITEDEFCDASKVHGNAPEEIVVSAQANETLRRDCTLEAAENENSRCVRDEKTNQTEKRWIG